MENIEIKACISDLMQIRDKIMQLENHHYLGIDQQTDTYFKTSKGRFKMRESSMTGPYLILYIRPDQSGPKSSVYHRLSVEDTAGVIEILDTMFGIHVIVRKKREIFIYQNVRIHLDEVENVGTFLEFEAMMDENNRDRLTAEKKVKYLMKFS